MGDGQRRQWNGRWSEEAVKWAMVRGGSEMGDGQKSAEQQQQQREQQQQQREQQQRQRRQRREQARTDGDAPFVLAHSPRPRP